MFGAALVSTMTLMHHECRTQDWCPCLGRGSTRVPGSLMLFLHSSACQLCAGCMQHAVCQSCQRPAYSADHLHEYVFCLSTLPPPPTLAVMSVSIGTLAVLLQPQDCGDHGSSVRLGPCCRCPCCRCSFGFHGLCGGNAMPAPFHAFCR